LAKGNKRASFFFFVCAGAMRTALTAGQLAASTSYFKKYAAREGTCFHGALLTGARIAEAYMRRNLSEPMDVALAVLTAVHAVNPPRRIIVGMSVEMRLASITPQWLLDAVTHWQLTN